MKPETVTRELVEKWSDKEAAFQYVLYTYESVDGTEPQVVSIVDGDSNWAKRIAAYYGIELPERLQLENKVVMSINELKSVVRKL